MVIPAGLLYMPTNAIASESGATAATAAADIGGCDVVVCCCVGVLFLVAYLRAHSGLQWPLSSFDLYNTYYHSNTLHYEGLNLITTNGADVPFDMSVHSSSGITRSYGWVSKKMDNVAKDLYLHDFLPMLLNEEHAGAGRWGQRGHPYVGVRVVRLTAKLCSSGDSGTCVEVAEEPCGNIVKWK
jgi:hypothetical protein